MSRIDIQLLQVVLDDLDAAFPPLTLSVEVTDLPSRMAICRIHHARSLLAGLIEIEKKETV